MWWNHMTVKVSTLKEIYTYGKYFKWDDFDFAFDPSEKQNPQ